MAKRFISTDLWGEDWFLEMPVQYRLFWIYITCHCDHAGLFKVNVKTFSMLHGVEIKADNSLVHFNRGKDRIRIITDTLWLIEDFFKFQYGEVLNTQNRVHQSIKNVYDSHGIKLTSIRGLKDLKDGVKDKDKDIDTIKGGIWIMVGTQKFSGSTSEWLKLNKEEAMNVYLMQNHKDKSLDQILKQIDTETISYTFKDTNHPFNYFKQACQKQPKEKTGPRKKLD